MRKILLSLLSSLHVYFYHVSLFYAGYVGEEPERGAGVGERCPGCGDRV